ncbi:hypothetical protein ACHQM5_029838 [Ranunculus cassubicifolius]
METLFQQNEHSMENNFLFSEKEVEFLNFRLIRNPNSPSHTFLMKPNTTEYPLSRKVLSGEAFSGEPNTAYMYNI